MITNRQIHIKALTNSILGFVISTAINYVVLWYLNTPSVTLASGLTFLFLVASYIRVYWLEVFFRWYWAKESGE